MSALLARLLPCLVLLFAGTAAAQQQLEIIPLQSQTVDRVLPTLLPLVETGGTLIGANDQLFLRASAQNRAEIKRVLESIDRPSRRLMIRVSQDRDSAASSRGGEVSGRVVIGDGERSNVDARVWDRQGTRSENSGQLVQTVEGSPAFIRVGRRLPIPLRQTTIGPGGAVISETVDFHDVGSGFFATPRIAGERVTIDISQRADSISAAGRGAIGTQQLSTTVSGNLGEWIELGGSSRQVTGNRGGSLGISTSGGQDARSIWLKVEEVQ